MPPLPAAVHAAALRKEIDERVILHDLSFAVPAGRFTALLGGNGAGKSTLLRILAGLIPATSGRVQLFGRPLRRDAADLRLRIGLISHGAMLYRDLSAKENLVLFARLCGQGRAQAGARADSLLDAMGLSPRSDDPVRTYSRGMLQRAAIARALVNDPELLLADEPFTGLDAPSAAMLEETLASLTAQGRTVILTNHDVRQSLALAQHVLVLHRGRLVIDEPTGGADARSILAEIGRT
jgi:heme exporter protein A